MPVHTSNLIIIIRQIPPCIRSIHQIRRNLHSWRIILLRADITEIRTVAIMESYPKKKRMISTIINKSLVIPKGLFGQIPTIGKIRSRDHPIKLLIPIGTPMSFQHRARKISCLLKIGGHHTSRFIDRHMQILCPNRMGKHTCHHTGSRWTGLRWCQKRILKTDSLLCNSVYIRSFNCQITITTKVHACIIRYEHHDIGFLLSK